MRLRPLATLLALAGLAACAGPRVQASPSHHDGGPAASGKVLVLHGSRAGSTAEVADFIGRKLAESGWTVDVAAADAAPALGGYQAVVIGSAVRRGSVLPEVRAFVKAHKAELSAIPVAYFVVCMTLREDTPENRAKADAYLDPLRKEVRPIEAAAFAGKLDPATLDGTSRLIVKAVGTPPGDYRRWEAIEAWARALGQRLRAAEGPSLP
jgi:menaquinone-dependent protoporphyrinogen oxidase